ncbi:arginase family protein [Croceitalea rosinachiae]|uniref:Arginase family protein n=1 Tax=Croceitalea rosinachiae TaxID=3075596 RepID=A0ABU3AAD4_9FLAO|nr:arginase family protein [Croceitalea sp. F388]MDT0607150.1 arginase family protein [Croceitalea sp. F388]
MKIYFPQWQGSGKGTPIEPGAKAVLEYLKDESFVKVPLSKLPAGEKGKQRYHINNFDALFEQLKYLKKTIASSNPDTLKIIGGDCGLEIVPVSFLNKKYSNFGVIWFDAHADINRPCDSASCNFHGMPLRTLLGEGETRMHSLLSSTIDASQIHYIGLRDVDPAEQTRINEGNIYAPKETNIQELVQLLHKKNIEHLYLHFDFDCLEPTEYPQTYYNVAGGLKVKEAEQCIKTLKKEFKIVGSSALESITTSQKELRPITGIINLLMI